MSTKVLSYIDESTATNVKVKEVLHAIPTVRSFI